METWTETWTETEIWTKRVTVIETAVVTVKQAVQQLEMQMGAIGIGSEEVVLASPKHHRRGATGIWRLMAMLGRCVKRWIPRRWQCLIHAHQTPAPAGFHCQQLP